jgi:hypothetical protein
MATENLFPIRLVIFLRQTNEFDGLSYLSYGCVPEDTVVLVFDAGNFSESFVIDHGQNGSNKVFVDSVSQVWNSHGRIFVIRDKTGQVSIA